MVNVQHSPTDMVGIASFHYYSMIKVTYSNNSWSDLEFERFFIFRIGVEHFSILEFPFQWMEIKQTGKFDESNSSFWVSLRLQTLCLSRSRALWDGVYSIAGDTSKTTHPACFWSGFRVFGWRCGHHIWVGGWFWTLYTSQISWSATRYALHVRGHYE